MYYWDDFYSTKESISIEQLDEKRKKNDEFRNNMRSYIKNVCEAISDGRASYSRINEGYRVKYTSDILIIKKKFSTLEHEGIQHNIDSALANKIVACVEERIKADKKTANINTDTNKKSKIVPKKNYDKVYNVAPKALVIRSNNSYCIKNHAVEDIGACFWICTKKGELEQITVGAGYCESCNVFFLPRIVYEKLKAEGTILCRMIDEESYITGNYLSNIFGVTLADESLLHQMGYRVGLSSPLSEKQRHMILGCIVDNKIMSRIQIINYLNTFISFRKSREEYRFAIEDWQNDINFINTYKTDELRWYSFN